MYSKNILCFLILIFLPIESAVSARETGDGTSVLSSDLSLADEVRSFTAFPPAGGSPKKAWYARGVRGGEHRMADNCLASRIYPFLPYNLLSSPPPRFEQGRYRGVCVMAAKKRGIPQRTYTLPYPIPGNHHFLKAFFSRIVAVFKIFWENMQVAVPHYPYLF